MASIEFSHELNDRCTSLGFTIVFKSTSAEAEVPSTVSVVVGNRYEAKGDGATLEEAKEDAAYKLLLSKRIPKARELRIINVEL